MKNQIKLLLLFVSILLINVSLLAQIRYVTPTGTGIGSSWATAGNLQDMINASASGEAVWVAAGTYFPNKDRFGNISPADNRNKIFNLKAGVAIYGGFVGTETLLSARNFGLNQTILSADLGVIGTNTDNAYTLVYANAIATPVAQTVLDGFIIQGAFSTLGENKQGGGIRLDESNVTVNNCVIRNNTANFAGGIFGYSTAANGSYSGTCNITNSIITGNTSYTGGAGLATNHSIMNLNNCTVFGNSSTGTGANSVGGLLNFWGNPTLTNTIFLGNTSGNSSANLKSIFNEAGTATTVTYSNIEQTAVYAGIGNRFDNPNFINIADPNGADNKWMTADDGLALQCTSPCINNGTNAGSPTYDILGNVVFGLNKDMGAYENINTVKTTTNARLYVKKGITTGLQNGSSWANAMPEAAIALRTAHANTSVTEIWVSAGTYLPMYDVGLSSCPSNNRDKTFLLKSGVAVYGGFDGTEMLLSARNIVTNSTILSGDFNNNDVITGSGTTLTFTNNAENAYNVVYASNLSSTTRLDGFTIQRGNSNKTFAADGGGVYVINDYNFFTLNNCIVKHNWGEDAGGGMYTMSSASIAANSATTITNSSFIENQAPGNNSGCGMYNLYANPTLTNIVFFGNKGKYGGGMESDFCTVVLNNVIFDKNRVSNSGAAIFIIQSTFIINNTTITNNTSSGSSPALIEFVTGSLTMKNCIIWSNGLNLSAGVATYSNIQQASGIYPGVGNINTDPLFVNIADSDGADNIFMTADDGLRLSCGSPSIDAGTNTGAPVTDILGGLRPQFLRTDMGAYESPFGGAIITTALTRLYVKKGITTGLQNGSDWANAIPEVAIALRTAHANASVTEIWVSAGTYLPMYDAGLSSCPADNRNKTFSLKSGVAIYGGFNGIETSLTARNWTLNPTILSGDLDNNDNPADFSNHANNAYTVVQALNLSSNTRLDGITISGGNKFGDGAGIYSTNGSNRLTIQNVTITKNQVGGGFGGGMYNTNASPILINVVIDNNNSSVGGGIYNQSSDPTLTNVIISRNFATNGGGGIFNNDSAPILTNVFIANNIANRGGGMYNDTAIPKSPILTNVTITNNTASNNGGGIYNDFGVNPILTNVTITNNTAINGGGGIYNNSNSGGTIKNSILYNNTTTNTTDAGREEIRSLNTNASARISVSYSCVRDAFPITNVTNGGNNINTDPLFVNIADPDGADNIWMTADDGLALRCNSPCINVGDNASPTPALDILSIATVGTKDMGAYEFNGILGNAFLATNTQSNLNLINQCESLGWTYYSLSTEPNKWLIGINWAVDGTLSLSNATAKAAAIVKIILATGITSAENVPLKQGIWTTSRYWDVNIGANLLDEAVAVRYYFNVAEINAINAAANTFATANSVPYIPAKFFKTTGSAFNPATQVTYNNINSGNVITLTPNATPTGTHNGVDYVHFTAISSFSGGGAFAQVGVTPLPVELLSFSGRNQNNTNLLTWATTNEVNNAYFEIERSQNAIEFVKIGVINANLSNENIKNYAFSDVSFTETTNYYRLNQVDNNGKTDYSKIIAIKSGQNTNISVDIYPNPSKNTFIIDVNGDISVKYSVVVYDMQGKSVVNTNVSGNKCVISLDNCVVGVYFVKISSENRVITKKIVKN